MEYEWATKINDSANKIKGFQTMMGIFWAMPYGMPNDGLTPSEGNALSS